jgi:hypothetical protein
VLKLSAEAQDQCVLDMRPSRRVQEVNEAFVVRHGLRHSRHDQSCTVVVQTDGLDFSEVTDGVD